MSWVERYNNLKTYNHFKLENIMILSWEIYNSQLEEDDIIEDGWR